MKIVFFVCLLFIPLLLSCSNCKETSLNKEITTTQDQKNPTSIVQNISIVTARIESIVFNSDTDYKIIDRLFYRGILGLVCGLIHFVF